MGPKGLAQTMYERMTDAEIAKVAEYASGNYETEVCEHFGDDADKVVACLDELERLCGFVPDDGE